MLITFKDEVLRHGWCLALPKLVFPTIQWKSRATLQLPKTHLKITSCRECTRMSFHVSIGPGRHQWRQSFGTPFAPLSDFFCSADRYLLGCPSARLCARSVMPSSLSRSLPTSSAITSWKPNFIHSGACVAQSHSHCTQRIQPMAHLLSLVAIFTSIFFYQWLC